MVGAAACGSSGDAEGPAQPTRRASSVVEEADPAPVRAIPKNPVARDLKLPLDAYMIDSARSRQIFLATEELKQKCMREQGFNYVPEKPIPPAGPLGNELRYGSADAKIAATYGYRLPPERDPSAQKKPPTENKGLSDKAFKVLTGLKPGERPKATALGNSDRGCVGTAERKLAEGAPDIGDGMAAQILSQESFIRSMDDQRAKKVFASWSGCMKEKGFDFKTPMDPAKEFTAAGPPTTAEKSTATADVECKQKFNVVGVWYATETAYQNGAIRENSDQLNKLRTYNETVVKAASSLN
ncbi:hypothetical protein [Streptomyces sp. NPDC002540]